MAQREYIAFISYRHKPLDMRVAQRLHRMIERYRIPAGLRSGQTGRMPGYVFCDRDELSVSSDLSGNITQALDHAKFLIVVCTPDTPGSEWVKREIAHFIRHSGRDRVLAVLAAGTPETSFPPELLVNEEGTPVEPLAANIVGGSEAQTMRALRREKPRILSALLETSYDALV